MLYWLLLYLSLAQAKSLQVSVTPQWQNNPLVLNKAYAIENDTVVIEQWKCYLRLSALYRNNERVYTFPSAHHLLNAENPNTLQWNVDVPSNIAYNSIEFEVGVDSSVQMQGVQGQDLDPENDMYWSWQSGYINTKLEATSLHPKRKYTLHIGGYRSPFNSLERFRVNTTGDSIQLACPIDTWMDDARKLPLSQIMKPGTEAQHLATMWANTWHTLTP